jgi:hypothetical protein
MRLKQNKLIPKDSLEKTSIPSSDFLSKALKMTLKIESHD